MKFINYAWIWAVCLTFCLYGGNAVAEVVAVVSSKNQVKTLSKTQVADIFLGKVRRFPDGTAALPIDQAEGSSARDEFYTKVAAKTAAQMKAHWSKIIFTGRGRPPLWGANIAELKKRIAENPSAIGYIDRAQLDASIREIP
ncbi:MAG: phosphate ABC transporter substrate-binding protein [Steroidobacteraceae bacterium]